MAELLTWQGEWKMVDPSDLTLNQKAILLTMDKIPIRHVDDKLYFEKFLFLLSKSAPEYLEDLGDSFEAHHFGMYSEYADEIMQQLKDLRLTEGARLTSDGENIVRQLRGDKDVAEIGQKLDKLTDAVTSAGLDKNDLMYLAYSLYPELTDKSLIKGSINSAKLETFSIQVEELKEGREVTFKSDKGNQLNVRRTGGKITIEGLK